MVAETNWQISTSNSSGLRNFSGDSASFTSALAPRRPWSRSERARDLFMRTSDVSAMAKKPESTSSTATRDAEVGVARRPGRGDHDGLASGSGAPAVRARAPPSARPPRRPRGPSRAGASTPCTTSSAISSSKEHSCSTALRAATAGQITMSPTSWGISAVGGSPGPLPPASGTRPVGSGSSSMGKHRTSVGPSLPMNC